MIRHGRAVEQTSSFGNGLKIKENKRYKNIIVESAKTLSTRFDENIKSIRSWDFNKEVWQFPSKEALNYWKEVDLYLGGSEHATSI